MQVNLSFDPEDLDAMQRSVKAYRARYGQDMSNVEKLRFDALYHHLTIVSLTSRREMTDPHDKSQDIAV